MIATTFEIKQISKLEPLNDPSVHQDVILPLQRIVNFSADDFEDFIAEWAIACVKTKYKDVYRIGGSGDKGRDVIAEYEDGNFDYYQCKKYAAKLQPNQYWIEFGKLCYFIYNNDIPMPKKYYIVASNNLSNKMRKLIQNKEKIREGLIQEWDGKCSESIIKNKTIALDDKLLRFIENFDFNIIDACSINTIIEEHRHTHYFYFRFGGNKKPLRSTNMTPPKIAEIAEQKYINKILDAYSQSKRQTIDIEKLKEYAELDEDFKIRRKEYYSAESLRRCVRDVFTTENEFDILKNEMHSGIRDFTVSNFKDGFDKLKKTMHEATKVNLSVSRIDNDLHFVGNDDKKGLCHHLANDDRLKWRVDDE